MDTQAVDLILRSTEPLLAQGSPVLSSAALQETTQKLRDRHWLAQQGVEVRLDETGMSFELREDVFPTLIDLRERLRKVLKISEAQAPSVRIRRYALGDAHGVHTDHYEWQGKFLLATAILYLTDVEAGGETRFVDVPGRLSIKPVANSVSVWVNYRDDLSEDALTRHESTAVEQGDKLVAIYLFYGNKSEVPQIRRALTALPRQSDA